MIDLYCIGGLAVDLLLKIPRLPQPDEKLMVKYCGHQAGGLIANTACAAARLGLRTSWFGRAGDDENSKKLLDAFSSYGVQTSSVVIKPGSTTDFTVVLLHPGGERTILIAPVLPSPPPLTSEVIHALKQARIGYTLPYELDWFVRFAETLHMGNGRVAIDLEGPMPQKEIDKKTILKHADIVFCNQDGLLDFTGQREVTKGADSIITFGPEMLIVTLGKKGAKFFSRSEQNSIPAYDIPVIDSTGAGDCFHAAFIFGILSHWNNQRCLEFANAAAAFSVQKLGAREGLPTFVEVQNFMYSNSLKMEKLI